MKLRWPLNKYHTPVAERETEPVVVTRLPTTMGSNGGSKTKSAIPDDFWYIDEEAVLRPSESTFYQMSIDVFFNARHYVIFQGLLGPEHAHSYRLQATCRSQALAHKDQVVIGYQFLRQKMVQLVNAYNNQVLNDLPPFKNLQPTTENLTAILFQQLDRLLQEFELGLISITVWESPTEAITYTRDSHNSSRARNSVETSYETI
jgi:6-pyruvoyltetrahydropterin/6-carboxytetrahydropterin synthase